MNSRHAFRAGAVMSLAALLGGGVMLSGCAQTGQGGSRDQLTANVGNYDPPPPGAERVRVAVPPFGVEDTDSRNLAFDSNRLQGMAADQLTTLMVRTDRFDVIERGQLEQLLAEQDLEGIVRPGELARPGQVRGVDYLLIGNITGFRITAEQTEQEVGVQRGWVADEFLGGFTGGVDQRETILTTEMGVDLRLVDPTTGEVVAADFSQFRQEDTASSFGIDVGGIGGGGDASIEIGEDDAGRVMRLAFDDAVRKMLPTVDRNVLTARSPAGASGADDTAQLEQRGGSQFCSNCGEEPSADARFCGGCGSQVE